MKKISLLVLSIVFLGITLNAQTTSVGLNHNSQTQENAKPVIATENINILYRGVDNPISIAVDGISDEYLSAEITGGRGTIKKVGKCEYIVNVDYGTYEQTMTIERMYKDGTIYQIDTVLNVENDNICIEVKAKINNKEISLGSKSFKVKDIKKPIAQININDGGFINKDALLSKPYIQAEVEDFDFPVEYKVIGFQMSFSSYKNEAPLISRDEKFTPQMIEKIKTLKKGDKIYIEGIRVAGRYGEKSVSNPQMIFTIK
jgi:hypothetical protein